MANRTAPCRVCGKQFIPCAKSSKEIGAFNYMEVACSPKCGEEYLKRVMAGRKKSAVTKTNTVISKETVETDSSKVESEKTDYNYKKSNQKKYAASEDAK